MTKRVDNWVLVTEITGTGVPFTETEKWINLDDIRELQPRTPTTFPASASGRIISEARTISFKETVEEILGIG